MCKYVYVHRVLNKKLYTDFPIVLILISENRIEPENV